MTNEKIKSTIKVSNRAKDTNAIWSNGLNRDMSNWVNEGSKRPSDSLVRVNRPKSLLNDRKAGRFQRVDATL